MANVLIDETVMQALASLLREFTGGDAKYLPSAMPPGFRALLEAGGGGEVIEPVLTVLEVAQNGVYLPGEGVDGFNMVTVSVPTADIEKGIVVNATDANGNWTDVVVYGDFPATMFKGNTGLQKVALVGATNIPANAFDGCTALASISLPVGVTSIGNYAFRNCKALTSVSLPDGLLSIGDTAFGATAITELVIPASVTTVANYAFLNCTSLAKVVWNPLAVAKVGAYNYPAFKGCTALTDFVFADGMTIIPEAILAGTTAIASVVIPETVTTIGNDVFYSSTGLTTITIPASVQSVGLHAFYKCTALEEVHWNAHAIASVGSSSCPPFNGCSALTKFIIAEDVTILPTYLLRSCTGIQNIVIPDSVITINTYAFENCSSLVSVQIGESAECAIESIGTKAFGSCSKLTDITIYKAADSVSGSPWGATAATVTWAV